MNSFIVAMLKACYDDCGQDYNLFKHLVQKRTSLDIEVMRNESDYRFVIDSYVFNNWMPKKK